MRQSDNNNPVELRQLQRWWLCLRNKTEIQKKNKNANFKNFLQVRSFPHVTSDNDAHLKDMKSFPVLESTSGF